MKHWRRTLKLKDGIVVRYHGMFQCLCGGRIPFMEVYYTYDMLRGLTLKELRAFVRVRRRMALRDLQEFAETSELCHDGENHTETDAAGSGTDLPRTDSRSYS